MKNLLSTKIAISLCLALTISCTRNRAATQYEEAMLYLDSLKNTDHYAKINDAISLLQKSAESGHAKAQYELGELYWMNQDSLIPIEIDTLLAIQWYEKSAEQCYAQAQYRLAYIYEESPEPFKNPQRAFELYNAAAEQGFADALYRIGRLYAYGFQDIVSKNDTIALKYYQQAVDAGSTAAMLSLGLHYYYLGGIDKQKTIDLLRRAAELGHPEAQYRLGLSYMYGIKDIIPINYDNAIKWLELAAQHNHLKACNELGDYYAKKYAKDWQKCSTTALPWYEKSFKIRHNIIALRSMGDVYFRFFVDNMYNGSAILFAMQAVRIYEDIIIMDMCIQKGMRKYLTGIEMDGFEMDLKKHTLPVYSSNSATIKCKLGVLHVYLGKTLRNNEKRLEGQKWIQEAAAEGSEHAKEIIRNHYSF